MKKQTRNYEYPKRLTLGEKTAFIMEVAEMVVSKELGYIPILQEVIFDYCVAKYYGSEQVFSDDVFSLDILETYLKDNKETLEQIKGIVGKDEIDSMYTACGEAIEFRKAHFSDYKEEIDELLTVVREFLVKPDRMDVLLTALTDWISSATTKEINLDEVNKLLEIIPVMKDMGSAEVAKVIINNGVQ